MIRITLTILVLIALWLIAALVFNMTTSEILNPFALILLVVLVGEWISKRHREWKKKRDEIRKAKKSGELCASCGYNMAGQEIPRCPECGALRGFTTPVDELGLTEDEIRSGFQRKRAAKNLGDQQK